MHAIMQLLVDTFQIRCDLFLIDNQEKTLIPFVGAGEFSSEARHKFKELNAHKLFPSHLVALSNNKPLIVSPETITKYFPTEVDKFFKAQLAIMAPIIANDRQLGINSEKWTLIYNRRSSIERSNKREKIDYKLESGRHRSTKMWYVRIYGIMVCQHMDAWFSHRNESLADLKTFIFSQTA